MKKSTQPVPWPSSRSKMWPLAGCTSGGGLVVAIRPAAVAAIAKTRFGYVCASVEQKNRSHTGKCVASE